MISRPNWACNSTRRLKDQHAEIKALPSGALPGLAEAFKVLKLVPERGKPLNEDNPDGGVYH